MKEYTQAQQLEIAKGMSKGLDITIFSNPDYFAAQMHEIRKGQEEGLDVSLYSDIKYNFFQMREIRYGLQSGVDVSVYARPELSSKTMQTIRLALEEDIDLIPYLDEGYQEEELEEIRKALSKQLEIGKYIQTSMYASQIREIRLGLESKIDVECYARESYNWLQMQEIRRGMEHQIDVSLYLNPMYNFNQMAQIRLGLQQGLDVAGYARLMNTAGEMQRKRNVLLANEAFRPKSAVRGLDGYYEFFFDADKSMFPPEDSYEGLNLTDWSPFEIVEEGKTIAVYHRATAGEEGRDHNGNIIPARKGQERPMLMGSGFALESDGITYTASVTGKITCRDEQVEITPLLVLYGDVDGSGEPIRFNGDVVVQGTVLEEGYIIATGSVVVTEGFKGGDIIAGGNVYVCGDAICEKDGVIQSKGSVYGNSFTSVKITAEKAVFANHLIRTDIIAREKVHVAGLNSSIVGGAVSSERGIDVNNIGNDYREETKIIIGYNEHTQKREEELGINYELVSSECNRLEEAQKVIREGILSHKIVKDKKINEMIQSLNEAMEEKIKERAEVFGEKQALIKMRDRVNSLPMRIRGTAYAGSSIWIDDKEYMFYKNKEHVIVQKKNGEVVLRKE